MAKCYICGKGPQFGNSVSHSKRHTKRRWLPNLQPLEMIVQGQPQVVKVCTRCRRTQQKLAK